ncbi:MAG TPA: sugar ABC transporter permease [Chloroflexota bacterium]|nr:sugar ABC transporter permease [Chloroflexota bacterium]
MADSRSGSTAGGSAAQNWTRAFRSVRGEEWGDLSGYLFIAPALLMFTVFGVWPTVRGFVMAFQDYRYLIPDHMPFVGFGNFVEMYHDKEFWAGLRRSIYFTLWYAPPNIVVPLILASMIAKVRHGKASALYRIAAYLPVVLPTSVAVLLFAELFNFQFGYVNIFLTKILGLPWKPAWFGDPTYILPSMAIASVWKHMGSNTLLFLVGLYNINSELYEAASIDGANGLQQWRYVTLPMLKPILTLVLVLSAEIVSATQEALVLFNGGGPEDAAMTLGIYAYMTAFRFGDLRWGYAAAMNLVLGLLAMFSAATIFRLMRTERLQ